MKLLSSPGGAPTRRALLKAGGLAAASLGFLSPPMAARAAANWLQPVHRAALPARRPAAGVLLAIEQAGNRLVACGERGVVAFSDDGGTAWQQASVPVSVTLTALTFHSAQLGWAVGHSGAVLLTQDGGSTWRLQTDGSPAMKDNAALFDIHFRDERNGVAVGAFGLFMKTADGGTTWEQRSTKAGNPRGLHLYSVRRYGGTTYVAGEQGLLLRSLDDGETFDAVPSPYGGSFYCQAMESDGALLLGGLRGTVLRWNNDRFQTIQVPSVASILSLRPSSAEGGVVAVSQAGDLMVLPTAAASMTRVLASGLPLVGALEVYPRTFVGVGFLGASRLAAAESSYPPPARAKS